MHQKQPPAKVASSKDGERTEEEAEALMSHTIEVEPAGAMHESLAEMKTPGRSRGRRDSRAAQESVRDQGLALPETQGLRLLGSPALGRQLQINAEPPTGQVADRAEL